VSKELSEWPVSIPAPIPEDTQNFLLSLNYSASLHIVYVSLITVATKIKELTVA
jgi:hypothetical protein